MRYVTAEEFTGHINKQVLVQLTDSKTGEPDMELLEHVNDDAASEVDDYLRGIYALPLPEPAPRTIKTITADIMKFRLHERRDAKNLPDTILKLYQLAIGKLKDIQARRLTLDAPGLADSGSGAGGSGKVIKQWAPAPLFRPHFTRLLGDEFTPSSYHETDSSKKL